MCQSYHYMMIALKSFFFFKQWEFDLYKLKKHEILCKGWTDSWKKLPKKKIFFWYIPDNNQNNDEPDPPSQGRRKSFHYLCKDLKKKKLTIHCFNAIWEKLQAILSILHGNRNWAENAIHLWLANCHAPYITQNLSR